MHTIPLPPLSDPRPSIHGASPFPHSHNPSRQSQVPRFVHLLAVLAAALSLVTVSSAAAVDGLSLRDRPGGLPAYQPRFERQKPVIAIVGENSGTELSDFAIPYGVLARSAAADVITVSTKPGVLRMRPALQIQPDASIAEFDVRFPEGADYVIVPAVVKFQDPALLAWLKAQGGKGATLMSICDGAAVVAGTGLMDGHQATAHWASAQSASALSTGELDRGHSLRRGWQNHFHGGHQRRVASVARAGRGHRGTRRGAESRP